MTAPASPHLTLAGRLLLALPGMPDPRFSGAAIALCVHDANGALGIGIDSVLEGIGLHALLDDLGIERGSAPDAAVLMGGPVEPNRGFVLHSADWTSEATLGVGPWSLTASRDILSAIAAGTGPAHWLVALGYAGWGPGQLDGEMQRHGWHAAEGRAAILFDTPPARRWSTSWRAEGIDPALLASETGHA